MEHKARKRYTTIFKTQAVELLTTAKPVPGLAEELRVSGHLLYSWGAGTRIPQQTICGSCAAIMPASRWRMTF